MKIVCEFENQCEPTYTSKYIGTKGVTQLNQLRFCEPQEGIINRETRFGAKRIIKVWKLVFYLINIRTFVDFT